jgi:hypothetical protein
LHQKQPHFLIDKKRGGNLRIAKKYLQQQASKKDNQKVNHG